MSENPKRAPILYKGEVYTQPVTKRPSGRPKEPKQSFSDAQKKVLSGIQNTRAKIKSLSRDEKLPNEFVFCVRLTPEFSAKSYYPDSLLNSVSPREGIEEVGSRLWRKREKVGKNIKTEVGKLLFVRATESGLAKFEQKISASEDTLKDSFVYDVRKIESIDTLDSSEQILGIPDDWTEGRLEAVLHPFALDRNLVVDQFVGLAKKAGVNVGSMRIKQYDSGITFVSLWGNRQTLKTLAGYNPLRTAHPLSLRDFPVATRESATSGAALPPESKERSSVTVGIFDGGVWPKNPYLEAYVDSEDLTSNAPLDFLLDHGTHVAGLVLYGPLNKFANGTHLPHPNLTAKVFRVLPAVENGSPDPHEIIDEIEKNVPLHKNIKVFNLSFGPDGPILDDDISRFTFALDLLAYEQDVLFCVAVGNDGEKNPEYLRRIQCPSDIVNGLGVGAYTKRDGKIIKAPYSCVGPGREGNKMKPDIVAFGGCDQTPIHLVGQNVAEKILSAGGTSYATPIVSRYAAHIIGYSNGAIGPLAGRTLLIHTAEFDGTNGHSNDFGHGILTENLEDIATCPSNTYTLIYQASIPPGKYAEFKIPWIADLPKGSATFRWTTAVSTPIDPHSPDDYTASSVMVSFYPNSDKYEFIKMHKGGRRETKRMDVLTQKEEIAKMIADGWEQSPFPVCENGPTPYASEDELRKEMKWDSIDKRLVTKKINSVSNPIFHVHALARGHRQATDKVKFTIVLSVELSDPSIDLYSQVISKFDALAPVELRLAAEAQAQVNVG